MLIPLTCDAPVYHWPFATVGLIVVNVVVFAISVLLILEPTEENLELLQSLMLQHGNGINPLQWITSVFMHGGIIHLVGNMLFLWIFGLVVEGKLGWWRFLLVYLGIGVTQSAIEQVTMLWLAEPSFSLGASSAIYGIMAIALVWAPKNEVNCFYFFGFWLMGMADVPIMIFVLIYLGFDFLGMALNYVASGNLMGTGLLHAMGAFIGLPVGIGMLKKKMVDCEGWDLFHVWHGNDPTSEPDYTEVDQKVQEKLQAKESQRQADARQQFNLYLSQENYQAAATLHAKLSDVGSGFELSKSELLGVIKGLHSQHAWTISAPFMRELIKRFPQGMDKLRIKLAQICVTEWQRPALALEQLGAVDFSKQSESAITLAKKVARKAKQMQAEGVYELDE